jgi:hypothetical protein
MKVIKTASGKKQIKISKKEWENIGRTAGWEDYLDTEEERKKFEQEHETHLDSLEESDDQSMLSTFKANLRNIIESCHSLMELDDPSKLEGWIMDKVSTSKDDISDVKHFYSDKENVDQLVEAKSKKKMKGEDPCWDGYEMVGKKKKDGKEVPNCVPKKKKSSSNCETLKKEAAEYQGKDVTLNKPFRTPNGPKKFSVYVKNEKGNVIKVNFGDPNMEIKRDDPERKKSFRARHKCDQQKDKTKPAYWSCKMWSSKNVSDIS